MRRSVRAPVAQMQAQEKLLRKQLFLAILFLFTIVAMCCFNFKTYDPGRKIASERNEIKVVDVESLKAENEDMQKAIKNLKRELASQKKKSVVEDIKKDEEVKQVEEKQPEGQNVTEATEVSTASKE